MFWFRGVHNVSCISNRLWWGILLADFAITAFIVTVFVEQRLLGWCQTQFRITLNQNHKLEWSTSFNWYPAVFKLTNIVGAISNLDKKQCYLIKSLEMETDEQRKTSSCCCWGAHPLQLSFRLLEIVALGMMGSWLVRWCSCAVVWVTFLTSESKYSQLFTYSKKELLPGPQLGLIFQPRSLPTSLPSPMHPTNAVLRSWFHGGWPSNMLPSWFCCHWFCTLEFEQKRDEIKVRGVDVTKIVGYLITVSCFLCNVFSVWFCWAQVFGETWTGFV